MKMKMKEKFQRYTLIGQRDLHIPPRIQIPRPPGRAPQQVPPQLEFLLPLSLPSNVVVCTPLLIVESEYRKIAPLV